MGRERVVRAANFLGKGPGSETMREMSYSRQRNTQLQRLTDPMVWRYGQSLRA
jgi:hypothetical protein